MISIGTHERALASRSKFTLANGTGYYKTDFLQSRAAAQDGASVTPQSFLVEQDADSVILPHFHQQNEFQVVIRGEGCIGRHPVRPISVHYAGAFTGYGPITAGPEGLWYFTLRPKADPGAKFLPEAREEMPKKAPKRHLLGGPVDVKETSDRMTPVCEEIFPAQADGIGGWMARIGPQGSIGAPVLPGGLGRYYVVAAGSAAIGDAGRGEALGRWATVFVTPDEEPVQIKAGPGGAEVLVLQFPQ
jgi:hypothetical protein